MFRYHPTGSPAYIAATSSPTLADDISEGKDPPPLPEYTQYILEKYHRRHPRAPRPHPITLHQQFSTPSHVPFEMSTIDISSDSAQVRAVLVLAALAALRSAACCRCRPHASSTVSVSFTVIV